MNLLGFSKFVSDDQIVAKIAQCEPGFSWRSCKITQIWKFCQNLLIPMSFQTCMSFFLMLNIKEDILKNSVIKQLMGVQHKKETYTGLEQHEGE